MQTAQALIDLQCQLDEIEVRFTRLLLVSCGTASSNSGTSILPSQALRATYPEEEGCLQLAPAEQSALHAAHAAVAAGSAELLASLPNLSARVRLPGITLCGGSVAIHFQLPAAYPSSAPPSVRLELDAAPRWVAHTHALHTHVHTIVPTHAPSVCFKDFPNALEKSSNMRVVPQKH
jgi:hypothetical protein